MKENGSYFTTRIIKEFLGKEWTTAVLVSNQAKEEFYGTDRFYSGHCKMGE